MATLAQWSYVIQAIPHWLNVALQYSCTVYQHSGINENASFGTNCHYQYNVIEPFANVVLLS